MRHIYHDRQLAQRHNNIYLGHDSGYESIGDLIQYHGSGIYHTTQRYLRHISYVTSMDNIVHRDIHAETYCITSVRANKSYNGCIYACLQNRRNGIIANIIRSEIYSMLKHINIKITLNRTLCNTQYYFLASIIMWVK